MPHSLRRHVPADERVLLSLRPSLWFIVARSLWAVVLGTVLILATRPLARWADQPDWNFWILCFSVLLVLLTVLWQALEWLSREYALTDRRIVTLAGVLRQSVSDVPLRSVRNLVVVRSLLERLLGLGTLGAATAGTSGYEMVWVQIDGADGVLAEVRRAVDADTARLEHAVTPTPDRISGPSPLVLGLSGGIGAGKSEAARALGELGFLIVDSDKDAKEALDRPGVREELMRWWGTRVIGADGRVDRGAVAKIVFSDAAERTRLEGLVHPLIRSGRKELVERASREGLPGVVIDAPLLFEAGSDSECDAVIFIDAPREARLERVQRTRGWDEAELTRREAAQLPLKEKRERSDEVVCNDSTQAVFRARVRESAGRLLGRPRRARHPA